MGDHRRKKFSQISTKYVYLLVEEYSAISLDGYLAREAQQEIVQNGSPGEGNDLTLCCAGWRVKEVFSLLDLGAVMTNRR